MCAVRCACIWKLPFGKLVPPSQTRARQGLLRKTVYATENGCRELRVKPRSNQSYWQSKPWAASSRTRRLEIASMGSARDDGIGSTRNEGSTRAGGRGGATSSQGQSWGRDRCRGQGASWAQGVGRLFWKNRSDPCWARFPLCLPDAPRPSLICWYPGSLE